MTTVRRLMTADDFQHMRLVGGVVTSVAVGENSTDLILGYANARTAKIHIESGAILGECASSPSLGAGPALGGELISLLGMEITEQDNDGLSLVLTLGSEQMLCILVDESGYESYQVEVDGVLFVAIE